MTGLWDIILPVFDLWIKLLCIMMTFGVIAWLGTVFIRLVLFLIYKIKETYRKLTNKDGFVKVVRCENCEYCVEEYRGYYVCVLPSDPEVSLCHFCSYGKRRDT